MKIGMVQQASIKDPKGKVVAAGECLRYEDAQGRGIVVPIPPDWPDGQIMFDAQILRILLDAMERSN